jgi:hypothetical protein
MSKDKLPEDQHKKGQHSPLTSLSTIKTRFPSLSKIQPKTLAIRTPLPAKETAQEKSTETKLPEVVQAKMENSFGQDFSNVQIHKDSNKAEEIGAKAYTQGSEVHFAPGQFQPETKEGQELIGHELTHVVQQKQGRVGAGETHGKGLEINQDVTLEKEADEEGKLASEGKKASVIGVGHGIQKQTAPAAPTKEKLDEIVKNYNNMVAKARVFGFHVAADNLEHFLNGGGNTKSISSGWLREYGEIIDAEEKNQERFKESLIKVADKMKDGETKFYTDYWDRGLYAKGLNELFYASGGSTITSRGGFTLTRKGTIVTITGTVDHHWHDPYDWHAGLTAFVPGYGNVSDSDALLLEQYRGAHSFEMESNWQQRLIASIETDRWTDYFGTNFIWNLK